MSKVLAEPLGRLLFHVFLAHSHALDAFLLVEHIQECVAMPPSSFKTKTARKLIAKFLKPGAKQAVFVPVAMVRGLTSQIEDGKEGFDAQLQEIREFVNMQLSASAFRAFVLSPFYKFARSRASARAPLQTQSRGRADGSSTSASRKQRLRRAKTLPLSASSARAALAR
jgi:hypothetical protein